MKLPLPCNCVVQNVDVDGKPPIIDQGQSMNNSVVQSVNIHTPRGKLSEWFLIILLTTFLAVILLLGFFMVSKSSIKSYLTFVQGTIQAMDVPTNRTNTVLQTNVVTIPVTNNITMLDESPTNVEIVLFRWRIVDNGIHLKYAIKNVSSNELTNIKLEIKASALTKTIKSVDEMGEPTAIPPFKIRESEIIVPISTNTVTNVFMRVTGVQRKP